MLEAPTTIIILFFFFWIFNNYIWKLPWVRKILDTPNINGRFEGKLVSTFTETKEQNGTYPIAIEIKQTLTSICVYLYTERSCSYSVIASVCKNNNGNYELVYLYQNKTAAMNTDADMRDHHGCAYLEIFQDGKSLIGNYFNNPRERGRYGKITISKVATKIKGKF